MSQPTYITLNPAITNLITAPGYYVVENSVQQPIMGGGGESSPTNPNILLSIQSSNVKLNLGGQVLTGSGALTAPYSANGLTNDTSVDSSIGIYIEGAYQNIEVYNGTLKNFSIMAVDVNYYNGYVNPNPLVSTEAISIHDLIIQQCNNITLALGLGSLSIYSTVSAQVHDLQFLNNNFGDLMMTCVSSVIVRDIISEGLRGGTVIFPPSAYLLGLPDYQQYGADAVSMMCSFESVAATPTTGSNILERIHVNNVQAAGAVFGIYLTSNPEAEAPSNQQCIVRDCEITNLAQPLSDLSAWDFTGTTEFRGLAIEGMTSFCHVQNVKVGNMTSNITTGPGFFAYGGEYGLGGFWNTITAFNVEGNVGGMWFEDCQASNLQSQGWIETTPYANSGVVTGQTWPSQMPVTGWYCQSNDTNDIRITRCQVSVINAGAVVVNSEGQTVLGTRPTVAAGFLFEAHAGTVPNSSNLTATPNSAILEECSSSFVTGNEFSSDFLVGQYYNQEQTASVVMDRCTAASNYDCSSATLIQTTSSSGFTVDCPVVNVILRDCISQGHKEAGYRLFSYNTAQRNLAYFQNVVQENCISQGDGAGYEILSPFNQVTLTGCKAQSSGSDGYRLNGTRADLAQCRGEFNAKDGIKIERFFPYDVEAVATLPLSSLQIYGGNFTVQVATPNANSLTLLPNAYAPSPASLTIGGVVLTVPFTRLNGVAGATWAFGPRVLLLGEGETGGTGAVNNGVYALQIQTPPGSLTIDNTTALVYVLQRVDPWIVGNTVNAGAQIALKMNGCLERVYELRNDIVVGTTVPQICLCKREKRHRKCGSKAKEPCSTLCSNIVLQDCTLLQNDGKGFSKDGSKGIKVWGMRRAFNKGDERV